MSSLTRNLPPKPVLQHFTDLVSLDSAIRAQATLDLVTFLSPLHQGWEGSSSKLDSTLEDEVDIHDGTFHPNVAYSIQRLMKGLPSSRLAARQGFTLALTHLLQLIAPKFTWNMFQACLEKYIVLSSSDSGTEEREKLFGRLFALIAIIESEFLASPTTNPAHWKQFAIQLLHIGRDRPFLKETVLKLLGIFLNKVLKLFHYA
jgi:hypothetical protein